MKHDSVAITTKPCTSSEVLKQNEYRNDSKLFTVKMER
jgi:hypothetical protein